MERDRERERERGRWWLRTRLVIKTMNHKDQLRYVSSNKRQALFFWVLPVWSFWRQGEGVESFCFCYLDLVILQKRMIKGCLLFFVNTIYDVSIWALRIKAWNIKLIHKNPISCKTRKRKKKLTNIKLNYVPTSIVRTAGLLIFFKCLSILAILRLLTCLCLVKLELEMAREFWNKKKTRNKNRNRRWRRRRRRRNENWSLSFPREVAISFSAVSS